MADHCSICDTRRPEGGTECIVLNEGQIWIEYCPACIDKEVPGLTNADTGETATPRQLLEGTWQETDTASPVIGA